MGKIIGYARISSIGRASRDQLRTLRKAGAVSVFEDTALAGQKEWPQLNALFEVVQEGDTVIVTTLDRIASSIRDLLEIVERFSDGGVNLRVLNDHFNTTGPEGALLLSFLRTITKFDRDVLRDRQAEGIARAKAEGKYKGRKPTARAKSKEILKLAGLGMTRQAIADQLGIGVASVYRVLKDQGVSRSNPSPKSTSKNRKKSTPAKNKVKKVKEKRKDEMGEVQQTFFPF